MNSIYLYCLARPDCVQAVQQLSRQQGCGIDARFPPLTLEREGIAAVIGEVDPGEFDEQNLRSLEWVGPRACRHAAVVEKVMGSSPVLPVRFGTIFDSTQSLDRFLTRRRPVIAACLEKLRGKSEWGIKGYLDEKRARRGAMAANPDIQSRFSSVASTPGARYLQQKQADALVDAALRAWVGRHVRTLDEVLQAHAVESAPLRIVPREASGRAQGMVFNRSYLVTDQALPAFHAAFLERQASWDANGFVLELNGPWPAHNFCPDLREGELSRAVAQDAAPASGSGKNEAKGDG